MIKEGWRRRLCSLALLGAVLGIGMNQTSKIKLQLRRFANECAFFFFNGIVGGFFGDR